MEVYSKYIEIFDESCVQVDRKYVVVVAAIAGDSPANASNSQRTFKAANSIQEDEFPLRESQGK
jgi:hypothetical protein